MSGTAGAEDGKIKMDVRLMRDPVEVVADALASFAKNGSRQWFDVLARRALSALADEGYELVSAAEFRAALSAPDDQPAARPTEDDGE